MAQKSKAAEPPALDVVLAQLAEKRPLLGKLDDRIHDVIERTQNVLKTHLNMRVEHRVGGEPLSAEVLSFGKLRGEWYLLYETGVYTPPNFEVFRVSTSIPLLQCPRETRARMFTRGHMEMLLRASLAEIERQIAERERAVDEAEKILKIISTFEPNPPSSDEVQP